MKQEDWMDPGTGMLLKPGLSGKDCPGNGMQPGVECCCDECDHFLVCFREWNLSDGENSQIVQKI